MEKKKEKSKDPVKTKEGTKPPEDGIKKNKSTAEKKPADKKSDSKKPKV